MHAQVQAAFYVAGGGLQSWTALMRQMVKEIHGNTTNVATYIGPGNSHCGLLDPQGPANWFWVASVRCCGESCAFLHLQSVRYRSPSTFFVSKMKVHVAHSVRA